MTRTIPRLFISPQNHLVFFDPVISWGITQCSFLGRGGGVAIILAFAHSESYNFNMFMETVVSFLTLSGRDEYDAHQVI